MPRRSSPRRSAERRPGPLRFCDLLRVSPRMVRRCDRSDERGAALCARRGGPVAYQCHAGLTEVIAPVMVAGRLAACVNCGQVHRRPPSRAGFARLWPRLSCAGLPRGELERAYLAVPVASERRIRVVARILAMTAEHLASRLAPAAPRAAAGRRPPPPDAAGYLAYCARLVAMIESGADDEEVVAGMDRLAARLAAAMGAGGGGNPEAVSAAVEYFVENHARGPALAEAARRTGLTPYYLARIFRRAVGLSPARFLRGLRVRRARELLASGRLTVAQAAARVGYADPAYFSRHFRAEFGFCPRRARRAPPTD